jgi:predicted TIM-barrel fold metal-dependent hydrolase
MPADKSPPSEHALIFDAHVHLGPFRNFHIPQNDVDGLVAAMDAYGIDVSVVAAHAGIASDYRMGNDETLAAAARYSGRILGYCCINPNFPEDIASELERCFANPAMVGIKLHPELHGDIPLDGPAYRPVWEFAAEHSLPVLSHSYFAGDPLETFGALAKRYPTAGVIVGHGGIDQGWERACGVVEEHPNVWLDLAGPLGFDGMVEKMVDRIGTGRLLFGTDQPFMNGGLQIGALLYARLRKAEIERIVGANAATLFGVSARTNIAELVS